MLRVAIVGANGFIGSRVVETFHLGQIAEVRPVVRRFASMVRAARFAVDQRIADASDINALKEAFNSCEVVIDLVVGDPSVILNSVAAIYQAANEAGVRRLIYLSSASVHGLSPAEGTTEESPITTAQPLPYNSAKVRAERRLLRLRQRGQTEIVILRPAIVFGPRSRWTAGIAEQLIARQAYLIGKGAGICNSIYIDNLVEAIRLSLTAPGIDRQAYLLGDQELVTWRDLYSPIAEALAIPVDQIPDPTVPVFRPGINDLFAHARSSAPVQLLLPFVPAELKRSVKAALAAAAAPTDAGSSGPGEQVLPTQEMALLQQCSVKLRSDKAMAELGYNAPVSFAEGCRRSVEWLRFAGYPVVHHE